MTTAADDFAVEEAFEAVLAGRPVPEQGAGLASFAAAVRASATVPGRPNAALADLLADGLRTDQPRPSLGSAPRPRRRLAVLVPALIAKVAAAGAVAQAAAGAGIVLVAFTGAGVAGALPDSLQHGFATVASTVGIQVDDPQPTGDAGTPTDVVPTPPPDAPDATGVPTPQTGTDGGTAQQPATDDGYTLEDWEKGPAEGQSFGDWVSEGARHGYADGAVISQKAHERGIVLPTDPTQTAEPSSDAGDDAGRTSAPAPTTRHGNGHPGNGPGAARTGSGDAAGGHGGTSGGHGNGHRDD